MDKTRKMALVNSGVIALYIIIIASFLNWASSGKLAGKSIFIPIFMLMLFVFSAAFTSFFMFGRPALMYLDGKKKEAISLVSYTLAFFFIYTIVALIALIFISR